MVSAIDQPSLLDPAPGALAASAGTSARPLILVVEDNLEMNRYIGEVLSAAYRIETAFDGKEGLEKAIQLRPDLIVSDIMMSAMSGVDMVRALRLRPELNIIPIIILTAKADSDLRVQLLRDGVQDFLVKPFSVEELQARIGNLVTLKRAREQIERQNEGLLGLTARLEAANKELEAFSYSVSHDLRAPLRSIGGFSNILVEDYGPRLDEEGRRLLGVIEGEARRMDQLIDELLNFSRMGRKQMKGAILDMTRMAEAVFQELVARHIERKPRLDLKPLLRAQGDEALIRQVMVNLLSNAIKFTRQCDPGMIEIGSQRDAELNIYYVRDNGVGFDPQYTHKLFGVFQRLHSEQEFEGSGVGLALVQRIIHRHGGRVWAEGKVNGGATLYFTLPGANGG
jgi:signal transduction histidine kinase